MTIDRRSFLTACTRAGIASPLLPGVLYALAAQAQDAAPANAGEPAKITAGMIDQAAAMAGVGPFTAEQKQMMLDGLNDQRHGYDAIRALNLPNSVPPAFVFHPLPRAELIMQPPPCGTTLATLTDAMAGIHSDRYETHGNCDTLADSLDAHSPVVWNAGLSATIPSGYRPKSRRSTRYIRVCYTAERNM